MHRVLNIRSSRFLGGPEKQILGFAREVQRLGVAPSVACWALGNDPPDLASAARHAGLPAIVLRRRRAFDPRAIADVLRCVRSTRADLVAAHDYKAVLLALPACRLLGTPIIGHARGWTGHTIRVRAYETVERIAFRALDLVLAVSEAKRRELLRLGVPPGKTLTVHNSVDVSEPGLVKGRRYRARHKIGLDDKTLAIGSVGRLSPEKGHAVLIEALSCLSNSGVTPKLILVGDGPEAEYLRTTARRLGVDHQVSFMGFREDAADLIAGLDLFVLPSFTEGLPNVLLEAFANQVPVVASQVGGVPELVEHGHTGLLVPPRDSRALAEAIAAMLTDHQAAARMAHAGSQLVRTRFSFAANAPRLVEAYRKAMRWSQGS
ncbi:MAG: glycosyltransferase family 4 protein [Armatimonadota bacterium]